MGEMGTLKSTIDSLATCHIGKQRLRERGINYRTCKF